MERLSFLFTRYKNAECTPEELEELLDAFAMEDQAEPIMDEISGILDDDFSDTPELSRSVEDVYTNLCREIFPGQQKAHRILRITWLKRIAVAASILIVAGAALLYYRYSYTASDSGSYYTNDITSGSNKATIKLASGKIISLIGSKKGVVIDASKLAYNDGTAVIDNQSDEVQMLTMQTPRGGQYEATLPDGTHIWLNAESTLQFPSRFIVNDRTVKLSGEAYFEVSHDKLKPFRVISKGQQVTVLGTHFNVEAYGNENSTKTTLLEGAVSVNVNNILKPGEQSVLKDNMIEVQKVDADDAVAWKNGLFVFQDESLESIMRKVARWYDVEVVYQGADKNKLFFGGVSRFDNISSLLKMLESTKGVHFRIEGRRLTVMR